MEPNAYNITAGEGNGVLCQGIIVSILNWIRIKPILKVILDWAHHWLAIHNPTRLDIDFFSPKNSQNIDFYWSFKKRWIDIDLWPTKIVYYKLRIDFNHYNCNNWKIWSWYLPQADQSFKVSNSIPDLTKTL